MARRKTALVIGVAALAGLAVGYLLVPRSESVDSPAKAAPRIHFLGRPLPDGDEAPKQALSAVRKHVSGWFVLKLPEGRRERVSFGSLGVQIDKVRLAQLVRDAGDPTSPLRTVLRRLGRTGDGDPIELPVPLVVDFERALPTLLKLKDEHDQPPVDARLDLEKRQLIKETPGRLLDLDATLNALARALSDGRQSVEVVFENRAPRRVAADLGHVEFDQVLGFFETRYDRSEKAEARTYNLRLAASKFDGTVLLPGEVFDFNDVVGPRDEANGYKVAPVIAEGELVDGIGGGTCQVSGTLHGAAFFAGLDIVERYPHTRPSSYIKMGLDATVVYPTINFRLGNPYPFPVVLHESVRDGVVRAEILGKSHVRTVTLIRRIQEAIPFQQVERQDPNLPSGRRVLGQRGVPGFKLRRYRILREGDHAIRERWDDLYPPTTQIVRVGTGESEKTSPARDDPHPEYLADELLVLTQGPDLVEAGEKTMLEDREPGRFGIAGWTEEAQMPVWTGGDT